MGFASMVVPVLEGPRAVQQLEADSRCDNVLLEQVLALELKGAR